MWFGTEMRSFFQGNALLAQAASSSLRVLGHMCLFPSSVCEKGTAVVILGMPLKPWRKACCPSAGSGQTAGVPAMCVSGAVGGEQSLWCHLERNFSRKLQRAVAIVFEKRQEGLGEERPAWPRLALCWCAALHASACGLQGT